MNTGAIKFKLLMVLFVVQLAVPIWMIAHGEHIQNSGKVFRFESQPVDPFDAFRGRYVTLNLKADDAVLDVQDGQTPNVNEPIYVTVKVGTDGYAYLDKAYVTPPLKEDYLKLKLKTETIINAKSSTGKQVMVSLPFDKYYLEAKLAEAAEAAYRKHSAAGAKNKAYVTVKIKDGEGQLDELYIGDLPIKAFLAKEGIH